jgi:DNA-binding CsgD family transcriptional regulator
LLYIEKTISGTAMSHSASLHQALEAIETLSGPRPAWPDILRFAQTLIGADSAVFVMFDSTGLQNNSPGVPIEFEQCNVDPEGQQAYVDHFFRQDIITPYALKLPEGAWLDTREHYSETALSGKSYYVDFMCKYRMRQMFTFVLEQGTTQQSAVTFHRALPIDDARNVLNSQPVRAFTSALQTAVSQRRKIARQMIEATALTFDSFGEATWLVTSTGTIIHASPRAHALMTTGVRPSLREQNGRLWHPDSRVREALAAALLATVRGAQPSGLVVHRNPSGPDSFELARADQRLSLASGSLVVIRQRRHLARGDVPIDLLCSAFNITKAEARVLAALISGKLLKEHAREHNVSLETVRTQIASLKIKMNCSRQVDLVRLGMDMI